MDRVDTSWANRQWLPTVAAFIDSVRIDAVCRHHAVELGTIDAQYPGGLRDVATSRSQSLSYDHGFRIFQINGKAIERGH